MGVLSSLVISTNAELRVALLLLGDGESSVSTRAPLIPPKLGGAGMPQYFQVGVQSPHWAILILQRWKMLIIGYQKSKSWIPTLPSLAPSGGGLGVPHYILVKMAV